MLNLEELPLDDLSSIINDHYEGTIVPIIEKDVIDEISQRGVLKKYIMSDEFKDEITHILDKNMVYEINEEKFNELVSLRSKELIDAIVHHELLTTLKSYILDTTFNDEELDSYFGFSFYNDEGDSENFNESKEYLDEIINHKVELKDFVEEMLNDYDQGLLVEEIADEIEENKDVFVDFNGMYGGFDVKDWIFDLIADAK